MKRCGMTRSYTGTEGAHSALMQESVTIYKRQCLLKTAELLAAVHCRATREQTILRRPENGSYKLFGAMKTTAQDQPPIETMLFLNPMLNSEHKA